MEEREKTMSLSDEGHENKEWKPLVPSDLDHFDREKISGPSENDKADAFSFKVLYDGAGETVAQTFSPLYGSGKENDEVATEPEKDAVDHDEVSADVEETDMASKGQPLPHMPDHGPDPEQVRQEAFAEGFARGKEEGYRAGLLEAEEKTERLASVLSDVEGMWERIVKTYEKEIIGLVVKVAEKVIYGKIEVDNEIVTRAILNAFEHIKNPVSATITVHPVDYEYMEVVKEDFFEKIKDLKQVTLVSDPLVSPGGCIIETPSGEVNTSVEERLEAVKQSIIDQNRM